LKEKVIKPPSFDAFLKFLWAKFYKQQTMWGEKEGLLPHLFFDHASSWWNPKHWTWIIPIFSILPKFNCCYLQQASWFSPHGPPMFLAFHCGNQNLILDLALRVWDNLQVHSQGMLTLHSLSLYNIVLVACPRCTNSYFLSM
jgi:hypothetical protein